MNAEPKSTGSESRWKLSLDTWAVLAAFLAADEAGPVRMSHLLEATRTEYAKLERPFGNAEMGAWQ